jgi:hypothetical protein
MGFIQQLIEQESPEKLKVKRKQALSRLGFFVALCAVIKSVPLLLDATSSD